jgi:hypothetical protein
MGDAVSQTVARPPTTSSLQKSRTPIKWRPRVGVNRTEMAELAGARNVIPHAGGARLLAVCPSGLAPGASADIVMRPEDLLAAWGA